MLRSETKSPCCNITLCKFINEIWEQGWLDEYSEVHFLIRAMKNEINVFNGYTQLTNNNVNYFDFNENFGLNFSINISCKLEYLNRLFGVKAIKKFVEDQLSAGKINYDEDQFFRALSEIEVLKYFSIFGPAKLSQAIYEPPIGINKKNPEARFIYEDGTILDIEVKTPGFIYDACKEKVIIPTILLNLEGREKIISFCEKEGLKCTMPRVRKLIEFINDSTDKFDQPSGNNHMNILYINWSYSEFPSNSYLEAYSLLYNDINGLLKHKEIGIRMGVNKKAFEKLTAIVVYTSSLNTMVFQDLRYLWSTRRFVILPNLHLDSSLRNNELLLKVTNMDYKKNTRIPHVMCDFKSQLQFEIVPENIYYMKKALELNELITRFALE